MRVSGGKVLEDAMKIRDRWCYCLGSGIGVGLKRQHRAYR